MKKILKLSFIAILIFSCSTSYKINFALSQLGVFEDKVELKIFKNKERKVVFIPMHHVGTKSFYNDVKENIDSLQNRNFKIYYELIITDTTKQKTAKTALNNRKLRKIYGSEIPDSDEMISITEKLSNNKKVKLKKDLVNQPGYNELGVNMNQAKNVDAKLNEMITYYEKKYGKVKLEDCDFASLPEEKYECEVQTRDEKRIDEVIVTLRNNKVINELKKDSTDNIAIIYGKYHFDEIEKYLVNNDYEIQ